MVPTRWLVLTVELPPDADEGLALGRLLSLGATAVEDRDGELVTYLPPPDSPEARVEEVRADLDRELGAPGVRVTWGWQPHEEWSETWRRGLAPRRIGRRLLVSPSWVDPEVRPDDLVIRIDPGMAFGTAEHATTRGCLELLEPVVEPGARIVDVGAGTGILSIAAALLGAGRVIAVESDDFACEAIRENTHANGVSGRVRLRNELLDASALAAIGPVDGIVANIQSRVLMDLLPGAKRGLRPGGWIILGGVLASERDELVRRAVTGVPASGEASGEASGKVAFEASKRSTGVAGGIELRLEAELTEGEWWSGRFRSAHASASSGPGGEDALPEGPLFPGHEEPAS